jgi:hypothetical protein
MSTLVVKDMVKTIIQIDSKVWKSFKPGDCRGNIISTILHFYPLETFTYRKQRAGTIYPHTDKVGACHILLAQPSGLSGNPTWAEVQAQAVP